MKGNIRTLGVFVVSLLLIFVMAGMASAGPTHIKGIYALTGFNSCSVGGAPAGLSIYEADYTFNRDGTGSATAIIRSLSAPDAQGKVTASSVTAEVTFTYEVTREGDITFGYPNHGNKVYRGPEGHQWWVQWDAGPSHGVISPDGKTMTISCGPPVQLTVVGVGGENPPSYLVVDTTTAYCITTLSGMRIK
jgi:hypothetical protein